MTITVTPDGFDTGIDRVDVTLAPGLAGVGKLFARLKVTVVTP